MNSFQSPSLLAYYSALPETLVFSLNLTESHFIFACAKEDKSFKENTDLLLCGGVHTFYISCLRDKLAPTGDKIVATTRWEANFSLPSKLFGKWFRAFLRKFQKF